MKPFTLATCRPTCACTFSDTRVWECARASQQRHMWLHICVQPIRKRNSASDVKNINAHRFCCCKCAASAKVLRHMSSDMSHNISLDMSLVWKHFNVIPWLFCFVHGQDTQYTRRLDAHLNHSQSGCYIDTNSAVLEILIQYWYRQPVSYIVR